MKQDMNRASEDHEHAMARFLQLKRNSEEGITQVGNKPSSTRSLPMGRERVAALQVFYKQAFFYELVRMLTRWDPGDVWRFYR